MTYKQNKKGGEGKYWLLASMILGLLVAGILLFFIFETYFTEDGLTFETCRESILLRANSPDVKKYGFSFATLKDKFPLRCKTNVVTITKEDVETSITNAGTITNNAEKKVADTLAECWAVFQNGDANLYSVSGFKGIDSFCVPCARITITEEAKKQLPEGIDIEETLRSGLFKGVPYYNYLNEVGNFPALNYGYARPFNLAGTTFKVDEEDYASGTLRNPATGETEQADGFSRIDLPKYFGKDNEDLIVVFGTTESSEGSGVGDYIPYLLYLPTNKLAETEKDIVDTKTMWNIFLNPISGTYDLAGGDVLSAKVCDYWEGVPA